MQKVLLFTAFGILLPATPALCQPAAPIAVFMRFDAVPGTAAVASMKREVEKLLRPAGVTLAWQMESENRGDLSFADLVVLRFKGKCRAEGWRWAVSNLAIPGESTALGVTRVSRGRVLPYSEIECDEVRQALAYLPAGSHDIQQVLGLALGRVVAHELYHVFAHTTEHGRAGLARASESLKDLVSTRETTFREEDAQAIRNGLRHRQSPD